MKSPTPGKIVFGGQRFKLEPMENSPTKAKPAPMTKEVLNDVLEVPKVKKDDKKRGPRVCGLPQAISDKAYRRILKDQEEAK